MSKWVSPEKSARVEWNSTWLGPGQWACSHVYDYEYGTGTVETAVRAVEALLVDGRDRVLCGTVPEPALRVALELLIHHALVHLVLEPERRVPNLPHLHAVHTHTCRVQIKSTTQVHTLIMVNVDDVLLNSASTCWYSWLFGGTASFVN